MKQTILYSTLEPLLSELYFLNYKKYNRINDRLIVVSNLLPDYDKNTRSELQINFENIISKYKIQNVIIDNDYIDMYGSHSNLINKTKNYILDTKYYATFIDEQDSFFLGDHFNDLMDEIYTGKFNLIGGIKDKLVCDEFLEKFNKDFNLKHTSPLCTLHLPQFINNIFYSKIKNFNANTSRWDVSDNSDDVSIFINNLTENGYFARRYNFDTFQYVNFQYYTIDCNKKLYEDFQWNLLIRMWSDYGVNPDIKINSLTLHLFFSGVLIQRLHLFKEQTEEELLDKITWLDKNIVYKKQKDFILGFLYYFANNIEFEYKDIYVKNFNKIKDYLIVDKDFFSKISNLIV